LVTVTPSASPARINHGRLCASVTWVYSYVSLRDGPLMGEKLCRYSMRLSD
jgi:hypothetical protein